MGAALVKRQFNTISPENVLKWEKIHPESGWYDFTPADRYVEFGETNIMVITAIRRTGFFKVKTAGG